MVIVNGDLPLSTSPTDQLGGGGDLRSGRRDIGDRKRERREILEDDGCAFWFDEPFPDLIRALQSLYDAAQEEGDIVLYWMG